MAQKPAKVDVTFLKPNFWHFCLFYVKTNDIFWNPETKPDKIGMF